MTTVTCPAFPTLRLLLLLVVALAAPNAAADNGVVVIDAYARAVPPSQPNSAVFMRIENRSRQDLALVAARSPVAAVVELHTHRMEDGMMKMRRIGQIEIPAGTQASLQPGGLHVMLIRLTQQLQPGLDVPLTLSFDDGSELELKVPVREIMSTGHKQE